MQKLNRKIFSVLLVTLIFFNNIGIVSYAQEASGSSAVKSWMGHNSTELDRSAYVDGNIYNNISVQSQIMKIGMDFGREALTWASFENISGGGFIIGHYDDNRVFHAERQTKTPLIFVNILSEEVETVHENGEWDIDISYSFELVSGMDSSVLFTMGKDTDKLALISSDGAEIKYKDDFFRGGFECILEGASMSVVNYVGLEDYVKGVIPYEMSSYWPYEALRAQAVCARTYGIYNIDSYSQQGFDLTDDTRSQVYRGTLDADEVTDAAVDSTVGQLVRYRGEVCEIYYFSADGGATEDGKNVFSTDRPYLAGKTDPFESSANYSFRTWSFEKTGDEIKDILRNSGYEIDTVTRVYPVVSHSGNVIALHYFDKTDRCAVVEGRKCYTMLGLHNCRFSVISKDEAFLFTGSGWGHNCGMSQWGAYAMADVYGYDYQDIIRFYFTGAYVL